MECYSDSTVQVTMYSGFPSEKSFLHCIAGKPSAQGVFGLILKVNVEEFCLAADLTIK